MFRPVSIWGAVALLLVLFICGGCAQKQLTLDEKAYAGRVGAQPCAFTLPKAEAEAAWARAQGFIAHYSSMKIQIATQYILQTYNPTGNVPKFGYTVTRQPAGDMVAFGVQCHFSNMWNGGEANQNAHILAHYMVSGEVRPKFVYR